MKDYQLSSMGNGMAKSPYATELDTQGREERDAQTLARLGKKSVLAVCLAALPARRKMRLTDSDSDDLVFSQSWASLAPF